MHDEEMKSDLTLPFLNPAVRDRFINDASGYWTAFWWYDANTTWPTGENDVLAYDFGHCKANDSYCFGRLPLSATEDTTEVLAVDSFGTKYKWRFNSGNVVAHAAWRAFHDHQTVPHKEVLNHNSTWNPQVLSGTAPTSGQDSFMYRKQDGVWSVLLNENGCDCRSSLSMGHGMCGGGYYTNFGPRHLAYGVDALYDPGCSVPSASIGLTLYFRSI